MAFISGAALGQCRGRAARFAQVGASIVAFNGRRSICATG
jgi:hypothetical protein